CKRKQFEYLEGRFGSSATTLCGRNAVQVTPPGGQKVDFAVIAEKMRSAANAEPRFNAFMLKAQMGAYEITVFADGRAIIKGTSKPDEAKTIYAKYIGA